MQIKMFKAKVATLEQKKIFHVRSKVQYVLGLEISYASKLPPIGEPKAAETPAAAPAAAISLLKFSF
jgi:hypothetical protein